MWASILCYLPKKNGSTIFRVSLSNTFWIVVAPHSLEEIHKNEGRQNWQLLACSLQGCLQGRHPTKFPFYVKGLVLATMRKVKGCFLGRITEEGWPATKNAVFPERGNQVWYEWRGYLKTFPVVCKQKTILVFPFGREHSPNFHSKKALLFCRHQ